MAHLPQVPLRGKASLTNSKRSLVRSSLSVAHYSQREGRDLGVQILNSNSGRDHFVFLFFFFASLVRFTESSSWRLKCSIPRSLVSRTESMSPIINFIVILGKLVCFIALACRRKPEPIHMTKYMQGVKSSCPGARSSANRTERWHTIACAGKIPNRGYVFRYNYFPLKCVYDLVNKEILK